jgi:hypothetical protein
MKASPTWLVILQAVSYGFAITAVFISIIVYFANGSRFRVRAYLDKSGTVVVEFYNRGRLAGTIVHADLARKVPRKMRQDDKKWYVSSPQLAYLFGSSPEASRRYDLRESMIQQAFS